jgi:hypothetical protein
MLIHVGIHWPEMAKALLWPMEVSHVCYLFNHVPDPFTGLSTTDLFTKNQFPQKKFHNLHVWGCSIYILDKSLQDGKKILKWKPCSMRSIYMDTSFNYVSSVLLVLNVPTGAISPHFHIVFDDWVFAISTDSNMSDGSLTLNTQSSTDADIISTDTRSIDSYPQNTTQIRQKNNLVIDGIHQYSTPLTRSC